VERLPGIDQREDLVGHKLHHLVVDHAYQRVDGPASMPPTHGRPNLVQGQITTGFSLAVLSVTGLLFRACGS